MNESINILYNKNPGYLEYFLTRVQQSKLIKQEWLLPKKTQPTYVFKCCFFVSIAWIQLNFSSSYLNRIGLAVRLKNFGSIQDLFLPATMLLACPCLDFYPLTLIIAEENRLDALKNLWRCSRGSDAASAFTVNGLRRSAVLYADMLTCLILTSVCYLQLLK